MPRPTRSAPRARALTGAALSVCLLSGFAAHAAEDPEDKKSRVDDDLSDARSDLSESSTDLVEAYDELKSTRAKLPGARTKARRAGWAETTAQREYDDAVAAYDVAKANEEKAEKDLSTTSSDITRARRSVGGFAGRVYQNQGLGNMSVVAGSEEPDEVVDKMVVAKSVGNTQDDALSRLSTSRANLVSTGDRLSALRDKTKDAKETKESTLATAQSAKDTADEAESDLEDLEEDQTSQAADLRREKSKDTKRVDSLEKESDRLQDVLEERARKARVKEEKIRKARRAQEQREAEARRRAEASTPEKSEKKPEPSSEPAPTKDPNPPAPTSTGVLQTPSSGAASSEFGLRFHPIHQSWRLHSGRDFGAACGTPVHAADDGRVVSASVAGGYGNRLVVDHGVTKGVSLATTYNHLESYAVRSGPVKRGQVIAYVGTTGTSTGCHLHFETRENGTPTDPRGWL